jgi:cysteine sulfinate desulfinase/cysteine desulfurase-like protein
MTSCDPICLDFNATTPIPADEARGSVRLTLGRSARMGDIEQAADALIRSWTRLTAA